jgi:hypothetical protein
MKTILLTLVVCFGIAPLTKAQFPPYVPATGLLAWYSFSGNADDGSGNGNNGSNQGAVLTTDRFGAANSAFSFDGTSAYIIVSTPSFAFDAAGSFTYSMWMNKTVAGGVAMMIGSGVSGNFISLIGGGTSDFRFGTNMQASAWVWASCPYTISTWDHYIGTYDAGLMSLYKNGVFQSTATYSYSGATSANMPLYIGRDITTEYFAGSIDDIGIWNRVLTPAEILDLYNASGVGLGSYPGKELICLFPNPADDILNLEMDADGTIFSVTDLPGRSVIYGKMTGKSTKIDIHDLCPGIYLIHLGEMPGQTYKFIKK